MKLKDGKGLSYLEIIKRLNLMGIEYNSDIIGKKYYIDLYNKAIQSPFNQEKIKKDLEKDKIYMDFFNQKLKKRKECSFEISNHKNLMYNNCQNNQNDNEYNFNDKNIYNKKIFFGNFNGALAGNIVLSHLCLTTFNYTRYNIKKYENICKKIMIPIHAIKKFTTINIYPEIKKGLQELINIIDNLIVNEYNYIIYFCFIIFLFIIIKYIIKRIKV